MKDAWKNELIKLLASAKGTKELDELLEALLTPDECVEFAKRWQIVKLLMQHIPQLEIRAHLKVSFATVTRGSRELQYGNGIFQKFYKRLQGH